MRLFVNLADTICNTVYHREKKSVTIEIPTGLPKKKMVIEIFGLPRNYKQNFILENYEITKMDDFYLAFEPWKLSKTAHTKLYALILPTVDSFIEENIYVEQQRCEEDESRGDICIPKLGFFYSFEYMKDGALRKQNIYFISIDFNSTVHAELYIGIPKLLPKNEDGLNEIEFVRKYAFLFGGEIKNNTFYPEYHAISDIWVKDYEFKIVFADILGYSSDYRKLFKISKQKEESS